MPIRINLLAEAQAAEDLRRRDPVKRSIYVAVCLVVMVLVWISSLQVKIMADNSHLANLETSLHTHTNDYAQVLNNKGNLNSVDDKLAALNRLAASRFLQAPLLNALMHATVEGIQITHLRTDQAFEFIPEGKPVPKEGGKTTPGRPASSTERIKLVLEAKDTSANPGNEQISKFKETLAQLPYFVSEQITTNNILLKNLSPPQFDNESGKAYVVFSLECLYPERAR